MSFTSSSSLVTPENMAEYRADGFTLGQRFIDEELADHLCGVVRDIVENEKNEHHSRVYDFNVRAGHQRPLLHIKNMWKRYDAFRQVHQHPSLLQALRDLTGSSQFNLWHDRFFYKPPRSGGFHTWHRDLDYLPFLEPYAAINCWVALDEVDEENGAMSMIKGSRVWGLGHLDELRRIENHSKDNLALPTTIGGHKVEVALCPVPKGHVHFHDCGTWHGSGPNWSDRSRCGFGMFFVNSEVRFDGGNRWAKDYVGSHGERLDPEHYPLIG
jgi:ectoine hydroxylase-related dioxygenase (phytanoyl-CoA dioxygenase family)